MSEPLTTHVVIECDGAHAPDDLAPASWVRRTIRAHGREPDLTLRIEPLDDVLQTSIAPVASDLLRIAAYAFGADQDVSRGGDRDPTDAAWHREFALCLPVIALDVWRRADVKARLEAALDFATGDTWHFAFTQGDADRHMTPMFDGRQFLYDPDSVLLFSGGADSLCAAVDAVGTHNLRPLLVSHRTAYHLSTWQQQLVEHLRRALPEWRFPHVGCWVHHRGREPAERTRRSRTFLVACLGAAVAFQLGLSRVWLADNGVVSLNVALNRAVAGSQASRSTHPQFLYLFNRLLATVFPSSVEVANPQATQTRAEVLSTLQTFECPELLMHTRSCSRGHGRSADKPHCGTCSQCVDRRFGVLGAGLEAYDPVSRYETDCFVETLPEGNDRTIGESYVHLARRIDTIPQDQLFNEFGQLFDAVQPEVPGHDRRARGWPRMLKRHATNVSREMQVKNGRAGQQLWEGKIAPFSLLGMLHRSGAVPVSSPVNADEAARWRRVGGYWHFYFRGEEAEVPDMVGIRYLS